MFVYLDTNVYWAAKFVFNKDKFGTLTKYIIEGKVQVLYTSSTIKEVLKHLEEEIKKEVGVYNRSIRKNLSAYRIEEELGIHQLEADRIINFRKKTLCDFLDLHGVEQISLNPIDAELLMEDYFSVKPPFETQKPNEFKDAIMINAIKNFQKEKQEKICIVSNDIGFRKSFEGDSNYVCFEYLGNFFKYVQETTEMDSFYDYFQTNGFFEDEIQKYIENREIDRGDYSDWECLDLEIYDLDLELTYIEKDEDALLLHVWAEYRIKAEIQHRNDEMSYYDKEEGRYLIEEHDVWIEHHNYFEEIILKCFVLNNGEDFVFDRVIQKTGVDYTELDDESMVEYEVISSTSFDDSTIERCSQCGKLVGLIPTYYDYNNNPLCEQCMVDDRYGMVCPKCGRKVPHELSAGGFCQDCFSDE